MTCFALVKGRRMRVTRLDGCGRLQSSASSAIVTKGFVSVAFTANLNEGEEINQTNANGETCVYEPAVASLNNYSLEITFCEVNPELYAMLTGQAVVYGPDGDPVGFRIATGVSAADSGFALEVWSGVPAVQCSEDGGEGSFGYTLLPFVQGGTLGDFTIENAAVTFTISNAQTKDGSGWGTGPYDVVPQEGGGAGPLLEPIGPRDHFHIQWTDVAPPEEACDAIPSGPEATGATAGEPGTWTPEDSFPPANFAALLTAGITADPATAWSEGEHVVLGDNSHAYWDGSAWVAGDAPA